MQFFLFHYSALEAKRKLDPDSEADLFCLHYVFEHLIATSLHEFQVMWDPHRLRTENASPTQLFVLGLEELKRHGARDPSVNLTELQQPPISKLNQLADEILREDCKSEGVHVPSIHIARVIEANLPQIQRAFPLDKVDMANADTVYLRLRKVVQRLILREDE